MNRRDARTHRPAFRAPNRRPAGRAAATLVAALVATLAGCGEDGSNADAGGSPGSPDGGGSATGIGGSTARMTIARDYLYAISGEDRVQLFDISTPTMPNPFTRVRLERGLETLFPYSPTPEENYLLVGAEAGVYIMDNSDVGNPRFVGTFRHARAQDPVVARDGYAYVTLRDTGGNVEGADTMSVVDVRDVTNPTLVTRLNMQGPRGLSIGGDRVYVCDGRAGIKSFDISTPDDPVFASVEPDVDCLDVIAFDGRLHVITETELLQYEVVDDEFRLLSRLGVDVQQNAAFARGPVALR